MELEQSGYILPRKRSGSLLTVPTGSHLHWGGIPGAATLTRWTPCCIQIRALRWASAELEERNDVVAGSWGRTLTSW